MLKLTKHCAFLLLAFTQTLLAEEDLFKMSLQQIMELEVITSASTYEQPINEAHANIITISKEKIARKDYQNLIEVLEDVPGFDFSTFEDSGEYSSHSTHRGIGGDPGNTKLIIMVDGIVQNHIAFNWSNGWTNEQMLFDLERIEIIQGPGSALYGANSFSGVINLITLKGYEGAEARVRLGENNNKNLSLLWGKKLAQGQGHIQFSLRKYDTDGDSGSDRPDPKNYFHNNVAPNILTENYDNNGNYVTNSANPYAGQALNDGFDSNADNLSMRIKLNYQSLELGGFYWDKENGLGSYVPGYEYYSNDSNHNFKVHQRGYHLYAQHDLDINEKTSLFSRIVWRENTQEPDTAFNYTYRYPDLAKSYHSKSSQFNWEERLDYQQDSNNHWIFGAKLQYSDKMPQQISLGEIQSDASNTSSSSCWDLADSGLNQACKVKIHKTHEEAAYILWDGQFTEQITHSFGLRYDQSNEYESEFNPRLSLAYQWYDWWKIRVSYATAFRQPSLFELNDEFRGNSNLDSEHIETIELQNNFILNENANMRVNLFYSKMKNLISEQDDPNSSAGRQFVNLPGNTHVAGLSLIASYQISPSFSLDGNYMYTHMKSDEAWGAPHKVNLALNWKVWQDKLNINLQSNWVGDRKTPDTNSYFSGKDAPSYFKMDLVVWGKELFPAKNLDIKLTIKNLLDEQYYGIGRQSGFSDIDALDPDTNPNPAGFIPAYHPQAGREFFISLGYTF